MFEHVQTIPPPTHLFTSFKQLSPWTTTADSTALVFFVFLSFPELELFRNVPWRDDAMLQMHEDGGNFTKTVDVVIFANLRHGICSVLNIYTYI